MRPPERFLYNGQMSPCVSFLMSWTAPVRPGLEGIEGEYVETRSRGKVAVILFMLFKFFIRNECGEVVI
jgi:hypothetical protein